MNYFEHELLLGYIFRYESRGLLTNPQLYEYAYSQGILHLALPYAFHISGISTILLTLFLKLNAVRTSDTVLLLFLIGVFMISSWFFIRRVERKYNSRDELKETVLSASPVFKKKGC